MTGWGRREWHIVWEVSRLPLAFLVATALFFYLLTVFVH